MSDEQSAALERVSRRLDAAVAAGKLKGRGGKLPPPPQRAVNRGGELASETVVKNRDYPSVLFPACVHRRTDFIRMTLRPQARTDDEQSEG